MIKYLVISEQAYLKEPADLTSFIFNSGLVHERATRGKHDACWLLHWAGQDDGGLSVSEVREGLRVE